MPPASRVFDAASWNGIAIDSTCGGHGTCNKCKVRVAPGDVRSRRHDPRTFTADELATAGGWPAWSRRPGDLGRRGAAADHPAQGGDVGVGRQVILRPAVQKRYVELDEPTLEDQRTDLAAPARRDRRPRAARPTCTRCARLPSVLRAADFKVTAVVVDEDADRRRARRHHRAPLRDRLRPRHHHRRRDPARPGHRHAGRGGLDAQQAAAVRRRRDHPDQRHDDGPRRARPAAGARARDARRARHRGLRARAGSTPRTSTRSPSPATPR